MIYIEMLTLCAIPMLVLTGIWLREYRGKYKNRCGREDCYICYPKNNNSPFGYVCDARYEEWIVRLKGLRNG